MVVARLNPAFWSGKRVLLTGHTGFKGAWLLWWLHHMGSQVTGLALPSHTNPSLYNLLGGDGLCTSHHIDLRDADGVAKVVQSCRPDIVLHLAAQALVRTSYLQPSETFSTNVLGTVHLLEALRTQHSPRVVIAVTTDKVYRNREWPHPYRESDTLGGHDPYSASKAACEIAIASYCASFFSEMQVAVARARSGNVLGGGDWSSDRLIPDAVRAWSQSAVLDIRRPDAVRPWQHVLEPLHSYLVLAQRLWDAPNLADAYNFGPAPHEAASVREVIQLARASFGCGEVQFASAAAGPHEAGLLVLDNAKSRAVLGIQPRWDLKQSVHRTLNWYRELANGTAAHDLCLADLKAYLQEGQ